MKSKLIITTYKIMEKLEKYSALAAKVLVVVTAIVLVFNLIRAVLS